MSNRSGRARPSTEEQRAEVALITLRLREHLAAEAVGRSRLGADGVLRAPQAFVAEVARIRPEDLSAALNGRAPKSLSVGAILGRLRGLEQTFNVEVANGI